MIADETRATADSDDLHHVISVDDFDEVNRPSSISRMRDRRLPLEWRVPRPLELLDSSGRACEGEIVACPWDDWELNITDKTYTASDKYHLSTYNMCVINGELYMNY